MAKDEKKKKGVRMVAKNRRARFDFELMERFEAGLVLVGSEVKSVRQGRVSIAEAYARAREREFFVYNMDIAPYEHTAQHLQHDRRRPRKLLLKREEIRKLLGKTRERGLTLVPTALYFTRGHAKLEIALARGRLKQDKRQVIRKRESDRELRKRTMKR
jgi:SsrA-binding protein